MIELVDPFPVFAMVTVLTAGIAIAAILYDHLQTRARKRRR